MDAFAAVAEPHRRRMLEMISERDRSSGEIAAAFQHVSAPAVSQHLKVLREAGLVRVSVQGTRRIYSLRPEGLSLVWQWAEDVRDGWSKRLSALELALQQEKELWR